MRYYMLFILVTIACNNEQATEYTQNIDFQTILNDSNWVEVTDTIHPDIVCTKYPNFHFPPPDELEWGKLLIVNNQNEYQKLLYILDTMNCKSSNPPYLDFETKTLLGYSVITGNYESRKRFLENSNLKEYIYLINIQLLDLTLIGKALSQWLVVPKLDPSYIISVDTLLYLPN